MNYGYYSENELKEIGIKKYGTNVFISRNSILYHPEQLEIGNNVRIDDFTTISGKVILGNYIPIAQVCGLYGGSMGIFPVYLQKLLFMPLQMIIPGIR